MFILLRRIETWLHQHIFKVGWLSTHDYQTTTILYYTFFMPGVILHEVVYYLAAGIFNVRAERNIKWPDKQEIGELNLNFVKLAPRTSAFRKAIVTSMPLLIGLISVWAIANYIFDITAVVERMSSGELTDIAAAFNLLISAPLFWLWIYIIFTIANTMFPTTPKDLKGWRSVLIGIGVVGLALFLVGIGGELFEVLQAPLSQIVSVLQATFVLIMGVDLMMVLVLGTIEYTIERITGHSATFRGNRMYTMTREEAIEEREKEREKERKRQEREERRKANVDNSPISIYTMAFSVPGAPNDIPVTQLEVIEIPEVAEETVEESDPISMPSFGGLAEGKKEEKPLTEDQKQQRDAIAARIHLPERRSTEPKIEDADNEDKIEKESSATSRLGIQPPAKPIAPQDEDESKEELQVSTTSRFGIRPSAKPATPQDEDESKEQPASTPSRFGIRPPAKPISTNETSEIEEEKAEPTTSRFGIRPPAKSVASEDESITEEDNSTEKEPVTTSRFGIRPPSKPEVSKDEEPAEEDIPRDNDEETIRVVGRPASPSLLDEDEEDDNSLLRRGRGDDAVASLFGQLDANEEEEEKPDASFEQSSTNRFGSRFGKLSDDDKSSNSRFGTSRFGRTSSLSGDNDATDKDDSSSETVSRFSRPTNARFGNNTLSSNDDNERPNRFGISRPAPKPISLNKDDANDDSDDVDDEVVYEDLEDEYYDYDEDDYIDYDDEDY